MLEQQERCIPPACPDRTCFNCHHQISLLWSSGVLKWTCLNRSPGDDHQMLLAGGHGQGSQVWCPGEGWHLWDPVQWGQYIKGNDHRGTPHPSWTDRHEWKHYLPATSLADGKNADTTYSSHSHFIENRLPIAVVMEIETVIAWEQVQNPTMFTLLSVDGGWSTWSSWAGCSVSCGGGTWSRSRSCTNPSAQHGGHYCVGSSTEDTGCNNHPCPSEYFKKWSIVLFSQSAIHISI